MQVSCVHVTTIERPDLAGRLCEKFLVQEFVSHLHLFRSGAQYKNWQHKNKYEQDGKALNVHLQQSSRVLKKWQHAYDIKGEFF